MVLTTYYVERSTFALTQDGQIVSQPVTPRGVVDLWTSHAVTDAQHLFANYGAGQACVSVWGLAYDDFA